MSTRCEDFPCCGHYERSTGEIFCYEARPRTPAERALEEMERRHEQERIRLQKRVAWEAELESRPQNCKAAYERAPGTYIEGCDMGRDVRHWINAYNDASDESPTFQEFAKVFPNEVPFITCHEDCDDFKACGPCYAEWEREAVQDREDEYRTFGYPDREEMYY